MAPTIRKRYVNSSALERLGPVLVPTVTHRDTLTQILRAQESFGGEPAARIFPSRFQGRRVLMVALRYANTRVDVGPLPQDIARRIGWGVRWRALTNRVTACPATIEADPSSPDYLAVWLNPSASSVPENAQPTQRRRTTR